MVPSFDRIVQFGLVSTHFTVFHPKHLQNIKTNINKENNNKIALNRHGESDESIMTL